MNDRGSKYYYSRLTDDEKDVYKRICEALLNFEPLLTIKRVSSFDIQKILNAVLFDNPVFFYLNSRSIMIARSPIGLQLVFRYDYSKAEAATMWQAAQSRIDEFMMHIKPNMKNLAKQIEAHRWMQKNIRIANEPYDKTCFSLVGALVKGECVCEGFAHAYKLICDRLRFASIIVTGIGYLPDGRAVPHAWNITRIDGITAHIDVTWDAAFGVGAYDYFNLTDDEIAADHEFDKGIYPKCNSQSLGYFSLNGFVAHNESELKNIVLQNYYKEFFSVKLEFNCDSCCLARCGFQRGEIRINKARNIVSYKKI